MKTLVAALALALAATAAADDRATVREADTMLKRAAEFLEREGPAKAMAAFNDPKGPFVYKDLYVAAYDLKGTCLADGAFKARVGKPMADDKDADGKPYLKEQLELAVSQGKGWAQYRATNPATHAVETALATMKRVGEFMLVTAAFKP